MFRPVLPTIAATAALTSKATAADTTEQNRRIIAKAHNAHTGQLRVQATIMKIKGLIEDIKQGKALNGGWHLSSDIVDKSHRRRIRQHVAHFVRGCPCCQKLSRQGTDLYAPPYHINAWNPMETLSMDTIGPLPTTEVDHVPDAATNELIRDHGLSFVIHAKRARICRHRVLRGWV